MNVDEDDKKETLFEFVKRTLNNAFIENIPMDAIRDLPKVYMYAFGFIAEFGALALFIYFVQDGYYQGLKSKYISLDPTSGNCVEVVKSVSGAYAADENGTWVGHPGYSYPRSLYALNLVDASVLQSDYENIMLLAKQEVTNLGNASKDFDLSLNLIIYMSWELICDPAVYDYCDAFDGQTFSFTSDAQYMLALSHIDSTLSNEAADCLSFSASEYDLSNALNKGTYNVADFYADPTCNSSANPVALGYDAYLDGGTWNFQCDVRSLVDSIAVNFNLVFLDGLELVNNSPKYFFSHRGNEYSGTYYIDSWYKGMQPLFCIQNALVNGTLTKQEFSHGPPGGVYQLCFLTMGNVTGLPLFMHYGIGASPDMPNSPSPCWCSSPYGHDPVCDSFDIISGMIFYNNPSMDLNDTVAALIDMVVSAGDAFKLNTLAYNASWAAAASTYEPDVDPVIHDPDWRRSSYEFCKSSKYGGCSILAINSYGDGVFDESITPYMYLVTDGGCSQQFLVNDEAFDQLIYNPPTPIVENYYECTLQNYDALNNSIGIASGNVSVVVPIVMFALLPLMYLWLTITGNVQNKEEYDKETRDAALDLFALQMLRIRDGKTRGLKKNGKLFSIAEELVIAAKRGDGGYPDSDDSDYSDEEDGGGSAGVGKDEAVEGGVAVHAPIPDHFRRRSSADKFSENATPPRSPLRRGYSRRMSGNVEENASSRRQSRKLSLTRASVTGIVENKTVLESSSRKFLMRSAAHEADSDDEVAEQDAMQRAQRRASARVARRASARVVTPPPREMEQEFQAPIQQNAPFENVAVAVNPMNVGSAGVEVSPSVMDLNKEMRGTLFEL